jgi:hypothetical protein
MAVSLFFVICDLRAEYLKTFVHIAVDLQKEILVAAGLI